MYISSQLASDDFGLTDEQIFNLIGNHNMEPRIPKEDDHDQLDSGHKIGLIFLLFILILFVNRACAQTAQYDTAIVRYQNIERIGSQTTDKGTVRYYAVYNDHLLLSTKDHLCYHENTHNTAVIILLVLEPLLDSPSVL